MTTEGTWAKHGNEFLIRTQQDVQPNTPCRVKAKDGGITDVMLMNIEEIGDGYYLWSFRPPFGGEF